MKVDKELIEHVASVARLKLSSEEVKKFVPEFKEILDNFSKLDSVNVDNVEPSFQPVDLKDAVREDKAEKCLSQSDALANTKLKKDGYFKGPRAV